MTKVSHKCIHEGAEGITGKKVGVIQVRQGGWGVLGGNRRKGCGGKWVGGRMDGCWHSL